MTIVVVNPARSAVHWHTGILYRFLDLPGTVLSVSAIRPIFCTIGQVDTLAKAEDTKAQQVHMQSPCTAYPQAWSLIFLLWHHQRCLPDPQVWVTHHYIVYYHI